MMKIVSDVCRGNGRLRAAVLLSLPCRRTDGEKKKQKKKKEEEKKKKEEKKKEETTVTVPSRAGARGARRASE